MAAFTSSDWK
uniref:6-phosphofructokinase 2 n=1 Tax=Arundo donax TaxID=35708 RepID=A0A0A9EDR6_ARUDO